MTYSKWSEKVKLLSTRVILVMIDSNGMEVVTSISEVSCHKVLGSLHQRHQSVDTCLAKELTLQTLLPRVLNTVEPISQEVSD